MTTIDLQYRIGDAEYVTVERTDGDKPAFVKLQARVQAELTPIAWADLPTSSPKQSRWRIADEEYITITTYQRTGESQQDWCDRHDALVNSARVVFPEF